VGFSIPNEFVVGYGLDYSERYRNLPYVGVLSISPTAKRISAKKDG
jgi:hypoxanthine-guanine phosphoribosyltransferase